MTVPSASSREHGPFEVEQDEEGGAVDDVAQQVAPADVPQAPRRSAWS